MSEALEIINLLEGETGPFTVYHFNTDRLYDLREKEGTPMSLAEKNTLKLMMDLTVFPKRPKTTLTLLAKSEKMNKSKDYVYKKVATVKTYSINKVFELTNSINDYWGNNPEVKEIGSRHRSTSVGGIIEDSRGNFHFVASFGFEKVNLPKHLIK